MKAIFVSLFLFFMASGSSYAQAVIDLYGKLTEKENIGLSEIAKDVRYIPLETSEECLLSDELQLYYSSEYIFVGDQKIQKFYRFDKDGKFLNAIGKKGEGPEEYPMALFFYVDEKEKNVYLTSSQTQSLYRYDYSGTYKGEIKLSETPWMIEKLDGNFLVYNNGFNRIKRDAVKELLLFNPKGEVVKSLPSTIKDEKLDMLLMEFPFFYSFNSRLYYKNPLLDDVFLIEENLKLKPVYKINTGSPKREKEGYKDLKKYAQNLSVRSIFENSKLRLITYVYKDSFHYFLVDKKSGKAANVGKDTPGFTDDIKGGPLFMPYRLFNSDQNVFIAVLPSEDAAFMNRNPDDNPVIVVAELK